MVNGFMNKNLLIKPLIIKKKYFVKAAFGSWHGFVTNYDRFPICTHTKKHEYVGLTHTGSQLIVPAEMYPRKHWWMLRFAFEWVWVIEYVHWLIMMREGSLHIKLFIFSSIFKIKMSKCWNLPLSQNQVARILLVSSLS